MTPVVTSRVETRGDDATVDAVDVDVDAANGLERAVVESKAKCMARLNARMGVDDGEGDDDEEDADEEEEEEA
jgi:hypothetical protein